MNLNNLLYSLFYGFYFVIICNSYANAQTYSDAPAIIPEGYQRYIFFHL